MAKTKTDEEVLLTLPVGHPEAGYVFPDLSFTDQGGPIPPAEQAWADDRDAAQEAEAATVAAHEDEVARAEAKAAEAPPSEPPTAAPKTASKSS